jgi:hypothetical protein
MTVYVCIVALAAFAVGSGIAPITSNSVLAGIILGATAAVAFYGTSRIDILLLSLIAVAPFHNLVRGLRPESVLLSGWRDFLFIECLCIWLVWLALGKLRFPTGWPIYVVLLLNIVGLADACRSQSLLVALASFRDVIKYSLIAVVSASLCDRSPRFLRRIAVVMFATASFVSVLQIIFYFTNQDYVVRMVADHPPDWRSLGSLQMRRMEAIFGGGPSNLGIYFAVALAIYLAYRLSRERLPLWWHVGAAFAGLGLIMTISFSAVVALGLITFLLFSRKGISILKIVPIMGAIGLLAYFINAGLTPAMFQSDAIANPTFYSYLTVTFFQNLFMEFARQTIINPATFFFGTGLGIVGNKSFLNGPSMSNIRVIGDSDGGWAEFALQVGVPLAVLVVGMIFYVIWRSSRSIKCLPEYLRNSAWALSAACMAMLSSIHIVPWIRVGSDIDFWIVLGALISVSNAASRQISYRSSSAIGSCGW